MGNTQSINALFVVCGIDEKSRFNCCGGWLFGRWDSATATHSSTALSSSNKSTNANS